MIKYKIVFIIVIFSFINCNNTLKKSSGINKVDLEYLEKNEGKLLYFIGKFKCKEQYTAFSTNQLILNDGTKIILSLNAYNDKNNVFVKDNNNRYLKILGKIYIDEIPEQYNIISRTHFPYMVAIQEAVLLERIK